MLGDPRHGIRFVGYLAAATPGLDIRAGIHTLGGYPADADQKDLLDFIGRMRVKPRQIRLVHGNETPRQRWHKRSGKRIRESKSWCHELNQPGKADNATCIACKASRNMRSNPERKK